MSARSGILLAGVGLLLFIVGAKVLTPIGASSARTDTANAAVTAVVRNDLGQLKWVATEATE